MTYSLSRVFQQKSSTFNGKTIVTSAGKSASSNMADGYCISYNMAEGYCMDMPETYLAYILPALPEFEDCILRFSSLAGLGMKPTSQPSFTNLPIHQSLLNFCEGTEAQQIHKEKTKT